MIVTGGAHPSASVYYKVIRFDGVFTYQLRYRFQKPLPPIPSNAGRLRVRTGNTDVASNQASVLIECGNNRGSRTSNRGLDVWSGGLSLFTLPNVPCSRRVAGSGDGVGDHA